MQELNDNARAARNAAQFVPLRSTTALSDLIERSHLEPTVLFQHDPYCPISRRAYNELASTPVHAAVVDVAHDSYLSRTIEERTGVRHESPQVLVFRSGKVVWSASHFQIRGGALTRAVQRAASHDVGDEVEAECGAACGGRAKKQAATASQNVLAAFRSLWDQQ